MIPQEQREYLLEALEGPLGHALVEIILDEIDLARARVRAEARRLDGTFHEVARAQGRFDGMLDLVRALFIRHKADVPVQLQRLLEER